jgi:hypothetical protein
MNTGPFLSPIRAYEQQLLESRSTHRVFAAGVVSGTLILARRKLTASVLRTVNSDIANAAFGTAVTSRNLMKIDNPITAAHPVAPSSIEYICATTCRWPTSLTLSVVTTIRNQQIIFIIQQLKPLIISSLY